MAAVINIALISDQEFQRLRDWLYERSGINLSDAKKQLVMGRLQKRLAHHRLTSYGDYHQLLLSGRAPEEAQIATDLLTTNETYFFREPKHFTFLRDCAVRERRPGTTYRVWSAACSSGEEPWSIAMTLADSIGTTGWEVLATDLSTRVLARAASAHYAMERADHIPRELLVRHCLRGVGSQEGTFRVADALRQRVRFEQVNLVETLPEVGQFDLIFLRNVLIYFDAATKEAVVQRLCAALRPGGYFFCGHSESLHGMRVPLKAVKPAIYQKV